MARPNILYLHSHDTGRMIQPYGQPVPTPNLQRFAEEGVLFRQCYNCNPTCSASRAALLTGQYPHQNGMGGLAHRGWSLNDYGKHLVQTLKAAGYRTALSGIQHVAHGEVIHEIGYDELLTHEAGAKPFEVAAEEYLRRDHEKPFFLSVGFFETHRVFPPNVPADDPRYVAPPPGMPDTPEVRRDMARFRTMARVLDQRMGHVLAALEDAGLAENTLVVCTTDHGIAFPRMKCNLTDPGIGVMLMMRGPGGFEGGRVVDGLVSHLDIYPTLCDLLAIERPAWLEGVSLLPLARGEAERVREEIHAEVNYHASYEPQRCVRTERYKYIKRFDEREKPVLPNCDASPSKSLWMDAGWHERDPGDEALYDLVFDPQEQRNLLAHPAYAETLEEMRGRLRAWMERTGDPLLEGPMPAPEGASLNGRDCVDPNEGFFTVGADGKGWEG